MAAASRLSSRIGFAQIPHALFLDDRLTRLDRDVAHVLLMIARRAPEIAVSNSRLAALARCKVRAVQNSLQRLAAVGWIALVPGVAGRLQRRISLFFRRATDAVHVCTAERTPEPCTYAPPAPPEAVPPMYPPVKPQKQDHDDDGSDLTDGIAREHEYAPPVEETCPLVGSSSSLPPLDQMIGSDPGAKPYSDGPPTRSERKASPGEVAAAYAKAAAIWGDYPETRAKVRELAVKFDSLSWVDRALDIAAEAAKKKSIPIGFLVGTLRNFEQEGGPPPPPSPKPVAHTVSQRAPLEPPAEATDADLEELRRWAEGSDPVLSRLGRAGLAKKGGE
jgi:hypothetical protein